MDPLRVTIGDLRVTVGHLRVIMGHLRLTIGYLQATVVHIRVTIGHFKVTIGHYRTTVGYNFFSISKHKANTSELHPKVRQTCSNCRQVVVSKFYFSSALEIFDMSPEQQSTSLHWKVRSNFYTKCSTFERIGQTQVRITKIFHGC